MNEHSQASCANSGPFLSDDACGLALDALQQGYVFAAQIAKASQALYPCDGADVEGGDGGEVPLHVGDEDEVRAVVEDLLLLGATFEDVQHPGCHKSLYSVLETNDTNHCVRLFGMLET